MRLREQPLGEREIIIAIPRGMDEGVKRALRVHAPQAHRIEPLHDHLPPPLELRHHLHHAVLRGLKRGQRGVLRE